GFVPSNARLEPVKRGAELRELAVNAHSLQAHTPNAMALVGWLFVNNAILDAIEFIAELRRYTRDGVGELVGHGGQEADGTWEAFARLERASGPFNRLHRTQAGGDHQPFVHGKAQAHEIVGRASEFLVQVRHNTYQVVTDHIEA